MTRHRDLRVRPWVFSAHFRDGAIVLDTRRNRYYNLNGSGALAWDALTRGATLDAAAGQIAARYAIEEGDARRDLAAFALPLLRLDLVGWQQPQAGVRACRDVPPRGAPIAVDDRDPVPVGVRIQGLAGLLVAFSLLRLCTLDRVLRLVRRLKRRRLRPMTVGECASAWKATLPPRLLDSSRTACLETSLALALLAVAKGWDASWCIGVERSPFLAHAWVESSGRPIADSASAWCTVVVNV